MKRRTFLAALALPTLLAATPKAFAQEQRGTVKFFSEAKGYGFIAPLIGGKDIFVHVTGLIDKIREGDNVSFDTTEDRRSGKKQAVNVKLVR